MPPHHWWTWLTAVGAVGRWSKKTNSSYSSRRSLHRETSKPNVSTIHESEIMCTRYAPGVLGLELNYKINSLLPRFIFLVIGKWCLQGGLGDFKNYSLIRSWRLLACPMLMKSEVEMRLRGSQFCPSVFLFLWLSPYLKFLSAVPALFPLLCQRPIIIF